MIDPAKSPWLGPDQKKDPDPFVPNGDAGGGLHNGVLDQLEQNAEAFYAASREAAGIDAGIENSGGPASYVGIVSAIMSGYREASYNNRIHNNVAYNARNPGAANGYISYYYETQATEGVGVVGHTIRIHFGDDANQGVDGSKSPRGAVGGPMPWYGNFLGPGPDGNPYQLRGYNGETLKPIDMLDAAAQRHDYEYFLFGTGGVTGALLNRLVYNADLNLAEAAKNVLERYGAGLNDTVTRMPITPLEARWAEAVSISFSILSSMKYYTNFH